MTLFLIRNKKTDEWLSSLDDKGRIRRRGHTHAKLSKTDPPRLFTTRKGADYALKAWLSGVITVHHSFDSMTGDDGEDWNIKKDPTRIADDMEIRECEITLKP